MKSGQISAAIRMALNTFTTKEKRKIAALMFAQSLSAILDLIGVGLIGVIGAISISGVASQRPGNRVYGITSFLGLSDMSMQIQVITLSIATVFLLLLKTILGVVLTKQTLFLLSNKSAEVTTDLFADRLDMGVLKAQELSSQQTLYGLTNSLVALIVGVFGSSITIVSDGFLAILLIGALFVIDPLTAGITTLLFGTIGVASFLRLGKKSQELGFQTSQLEVASSELVLQSLDAYRETIISNKQEFYVASLRNLRQENASVIATSGFLPHLSKYIIEAGLVLGAFILSALQFYLHDAFHAVATLTVFLAAGSRIAPAILRIQQSGIQVRNSLGVAETALKMLSDRQTVLAVQKNVETEQIFVATVQLIDVSFKYPNSNVLALDNVSLCVNQGDFVALVGPSGGGKSTLVDTILGVLKPMNGEVKLSNNNPLDAHSIWPGKTAYVPQQITVFDVSIAQNIALGVPENEIDYKRVKECLDLAQLSDVISGREQGLGFTLGEKGNKLSGGQRQRIGIARALYSDPRLIIFDEATSSLDVETEKAISDSIDALKNSKTILVIAHRLSTIKNADRIYYIDRGSIIAHGSLEELRSAVPAFERQALLSGL